MNLKESFRYQKFLDSLLQNANQSIMQQSHCLKTTQDHCRHEVNPEVEDVTEEVERLDFTNNDDMMQFLVHIVEEKERLSIAIGDAKRDLSFDLDAAVEANKARQAVNASIRRMLRYTTSKTKTQGVGYKFDATGVQQPYRYDVITFTSEDYNKDRAKEIMRSMISKADEVSAVVDAALINCEVKYEPPYDVNEQFQDVVDMFICNHGSVRE